MWWWGVCAGATCWSDVVHHQRHSSVYENLMPLMTERPSLLSPKSQTKRNSSLTIPPGLYTARNTTTQELIALKVFDKKILRRKETRRRLRREIRILSHCRAHPNLLTMEGVTSTNSTLEIAFELARGGEVMSRIQCERDVSRAIGNVTAGIKFLHDMGIIHGEILPEHILYSDSEPDSKILVADFGRAAPWRDVSLRCRRVAKKGKRHQFLWDEYHHVKFLPPWVVERKTDRVRTWNEARQLDIWALGVTMYVLLCGAFPFDGDSVEEIQQKIIHNKLTFPDADSSVNLSRAAKDLLHWLLEKDPKKIMTVDEVNAHPWIQSEVAPDLLWTNERMEKYREFADDYVEEVTKVSRRRRVSNRSFLQSMHSSKALFTQETNQEEDEDHDRPSFVSIDPNEVQVLEDEQLNERPSADGFMRLANEQIDAVTEERTPSTSDDTSEPEPSTPNTLDQKDLDDKRVWGVLFKYRRFFSFRSMSSMASSGNHSNSDDSRVK